MKEQLIGWRNKILSTDEEQSGLRERIAALAPAILPKGVGAYSAAVLYYEMRGFERFKNRRQVGSMTGLCPGVHLSDGRGKEGSINRCGIGIVRWTLVEMVWRLMIWQPQYPPVRRLAAGLVKGKRAKKRLVVQAARRLAIDLWRLSTGQTTPEKLGLIMHCTTLRSKESSPKRRESLNLHPASQQMNFLAATARVCCLGLGDKNPKVRLDRSLLSLICSLHKSRC